MNIKHADCKTCGPLKDHEYIYFKDGSEDANKLPDAFGNLKEVVRLNNSGGRPHLLMKCPKCETYYRYYSDYEYFPNGNENEEWLDRLTDEEAKKYI